jgi:pantothenate kinase
MNRLELRYTPVTPSWREPAAAPIHAVTPYIDGVSLIDLVATTGSGERGPLVTYEFPKSSALATDAIEILDCTCTDHGCGGLDVHIRRDGGIVFWGPFRDPGEETVDLGPFEFDARDYDNEVAQIAATLSAVIPWSSRALEAAFLGANLARKDRRRVVGVVGAPGAGKSTLAGQLVADLATRGFTATLLPMDGFHLPQGELRRRGRRDFMGAPDTFDVEAFVATLEQLTDVDSVVRVPGFDRAIEEPVPEAIEIPARPGFVIVEGNYLLHDRDGWERVRPLLDTVIYLAPDDAVRRQRLITRHIAFGKTPAEAEEWVTRSDDPNAALIAATASRADRILH